MPTLPSIPLQPNSPMQCLPSRIAADGMNHGFAVSVWAGGVPPRAKGINSVVVTTRQRACTNNTDELPAKDVHVVFSGSHVFKESRRSSAAQPLNEPADCIHSRQTLVVCGDAGSCSVESGDLWENLFSTLVELEDEEGILISSEEEESSEGQSTPYQLLTDDRPPAAARVFSHGVAAGLVDKVSDADASDLLKALGPRRAAYARRVSAALSARCRWRCPSDRQSCGKCQPPCNCMLATGITSPSSAFSLAFYSEAFGLLFFCRDKLGLASLLAMAPSNTGADARRPSFIVATSAANMRSYDPPSSRGEGGKERAIEVPIDGVWLLDLWGLAAAEASIAVAFNYSELTESAEHCGASLVNMPSVYCVSWEQPSIIRTTHMWCLCAICEEAREQFWKRMNCQCSVQLDAHECILPPEMDKLWGKLHGRKEEFAVAPSVLSALGYISCCGVQQEGGPSHLSSATVLKSLFRELWGAVARAIPEALQMINNTCVPSVSCTAPATVFVGLLFSGGVDSTLLAGMVLRVVASAMAKACTDASNEGTHHTASPHHVVVVELVSVGFSAEAPDRLTALRSFQDLLRLLHSLGERYKSQSCRYGAGLPPPSNSLVQIGSWALELRLVAVDVASSDSASCRSQLLEAIYPKRSHMDFNIAAPLYFSSRGIGYLVSPNFDKSDEWQKLLQEGSLWNELLIRPLFRRPPRHCQPEKSTQRAGTEDSAAQQQAADLGKKPAVSAHNSRQDNGAKSACRVCRRQAKSGCAHGTCKLCCTKLQAAAVQRASPSLSHTQACDTIHVGGQGKLRISDLGIAAHPSCPVHRKPRLLYLKEGIGEDGGSDACGAGHSRKVDVVSPFKSLSVLPCGVSLATNEARRPFMAMALDDLHKWCTLDERRWSCVDRVTGTYTVQSTVFLIGSGADEIFGGYGRHRTANLTKGCEALRDEQILDLRRLWFRNMGRDCRALSAFGRWARVPFLDERLLNFVCRSVPFEHIVQPSVDVREAAEEAMQRLLMEAREPTPVDSEDELNCPSASWKRTDILEFGEESTMNPTVTSAAGGQNNDTKLKLGEGSSGLCLGNKWLVRLCAAFCGLYFSAAAKKRAMQFGSRSAKVSNSEYFPSNRKARGDATLGSSDETPHI